MSYIDENITKKFLTLLHGSGKSFEIRLFDPNKRGGATSAFFNNIDKCVETLSHSNLENRNVFVTLHEVKEGLELDCRVQWERLERGADALADKDFANYQTFFIDLDPDRPKGVASSTEEYNKAVELAKMVMEYLENLGFSAPIVASSGNGIHLQYRISMPCNDENKNLLKGCLESLARHFAEQCKTLGVGVDCVNFNPARICKLYGTVSRKGRHTEKRPHRLTKIIKQPEEWELNSKELLEKIIAENPPESIPAPRNTDKKSASKSVPIASSGIDVEGKLNEWGLEYMEPYSGTDNKGIPCNIYPLEHCPFNADHTHGDSKIFKYANGAVSFKCHHDSCKGHKWQDVRLLFEPDAYKNGYKEPEIIEKDLLNRVAELTAEELTSERIFTELHYCYTPTEEFEKTTVLNQLQERAKELKVITQFNKLYKAYENGCKEREKEFKAERMKKRKEERQAQRGKNQKSLQEKVFAEYEKRVGVTHKIGTMLLYECENIEQALEQYSGLIDIYDFVKYDNWGNNKGAIHEEIAQRIKQDFDFFVCMGKPYIYVKGVYVFDENTLLLREIIKVYIQTENITARTINAIAELVLKDYSTQKDLEVLEVAPSHMANFKNGMLDLKTMELLPHDPKYYSVNQIPHIWDASNNAEGSLTDKYFKSLIPDSDDRKMVFEFVGSILCPGNPFQNYLIIRGLGGTGKSVVLRLVRELVGRGNWCAIKLQDISGDIARFRTARLLGKLLNVFADLPEKSMESSDNLKCLTGEDPLNGEYKGGANFDFNVNCKLLFSCNQIPKFINDKTNAISRRLMILEINKRGMFINDIDKTLKADIQNFITLIVNNAHELFTRGSYFESDRSKALVEIHREESDSVQSFLNHGMGIYYEKADGHKTDRTEVYNRYCEWYESEGLEEKYKVTKNGFYQSMRVKGFDIDNKGKAKRYLVGFKALPNWKVEENLKAQNGEPAEVADFELKTADSGEKLPPLTAESATDASDWDNMEIPFD